MTLFGREIATRLIVMVGTGALIVVLFLIVLSQCEKRRDQAAQSRVDAAQGNAAAESAADAVNTISRSGEAAAASEELSRTNEREIRNAEGADARVGAGVDVAGRRSLCRRAAYRDDPKCRVFRTSAP